MSAPSRVHQKILNFMNTEINIYLRSKKGPYKVYPTPVAVKLFSEDNTNVVEPDISVICDPDKLTDRGCTGAPDWIVDPDSKKIIVYYLEESDFKMDVYTFHDSIRVNIYDDLQIDLKELGLW